MDKQITHPELVKALAKPGEDILASLTPFTLGALHDYTADFCNVGDELDKMKKVVIYGKDNETSGVGPLSEVSLALYPLTAEKMHMLHMAIGIAGEAAELLDAIRKYALLGEPLDEGNAVEELGDIEFYMEGLRQGLAVSREVVLMANIHKLSKRYVSMSYSDQAAIQRADKMLETPLSDERKEALKGTVGEGCLTEEEVTATHFDAMR